MTGSVKDGFKPPRNSNWNIEDAATEMVVYKVDRKSVV